MESSYWVFIMTSVEESVAQLILADLQMKFH